MIKDFYGTNEEELELELMITLRSVRAIENSLATIVEQQRQTIALDCIRTLYMNEEIHKEDYLDFVSESLKRQGYSYTK